MIACKPHLQNSINDLKAGYQNEITRLRDEIKRQRIIIKQLKKLFKQEKKQ